MTDTAASPPLLRPIPRRPFETSTADASRPGSINGELTDASDISRPASFRNLTSSTLSGIFSAEATSPSAVADYDDDDDAVDDVRTSFDAGMTTGAGVQTPVRRPSLDDATYELMRRRSHPQRGRAYSTVEADSSARRRRRHSDGAAARVSPVSLALRAGLLFALGLGFGVVLARFEDRHDASVAPGAAVAKADHAWRNLVFWGVAGVALGGAMPFFDGVWAGLGGPEAKGRSDSAIDDDDEDDKPDEPAGADLTVILRAVGAFVGIVFAIVSRTLATYGYASLTDTFPQRKLAWDSTFQLAFTLASVNPLLWWLIDRSAVGLVLSAAVGVVGSATLLSIDKDIMPVPAANLVMLRGAGAVGVAANDSFGAAAPDPGQQPFPLAAIMSQETVEAGAWMLSVLFCSSLCFGNIGRRLAWDKTSVMKSRWVGTS